MIDWIDAGERPSGMYVFSEDKALVDRVLAETVFGGAYVDTFAIQRGLPSRPSVASG